MRANSCCRVVLANTAFSSVLLPVSPWPFNTILCILSRYLCSPNSYSVLTAEVSRIGPSMCNSAQQNDSVRDKVLPGYSLMMWLLSACTGWSLFPVLVCCHHLIARYHSDPVSNLFAELKPVRAAKLQTFAYCRFAWLFPRI